MEESETHSKPFQLWHYIKSTTGMKHRRESLGKTLLGMLLSYQKQNA